MYSRKLSTSERNLLDIRLTQRLPIKVEPYTDELLLSWIVRLLRINNIKVNTLFRQAAKMKGAQAYCTDWAGPSLCWDFLRYLSNLSGIPYQQLYKLTFRSQSDNLWCSCTTNRHKWLLKGVVKTRSRLGYGVQVCPQCLSSDIQYYKKVWRLGFMTVCPEHRCWLIDSCPKCDSPISFHEQDFCYDFPWEAPSFTKCSKCHFELAHKHNSSLAPPNLISFSRDLSVLASEGCGRFLNDHFNYSSLVFEGLHIIARAMMKRPKLLCEITCNSSELAGHDSVVIEKLRHKERSVLMHAISIVTRHWPIRFIKYAKQHKMFLSTFREESDYFPYWLWELIKGKELDRTWFKKRDIGSRG